MNSKVRRMRHFGIGCIGLALVLALQTANAAPITFDSTNVQNKAGRDTHLHGVNSGRAFTLREDASGTFTRDHASKTAKYIASVYERNGSDRGYHIRLNLIERDHKPNCHNHNCSAAYYKANNIDPVKDWKFYTIDTGKTNRLIGFGELDGFNLDLIRGPKTWFQFGDGAAGGFVTPNGKAFSGWFETKNRKFQGTAHWDVYGHLARNEPDTPSDPPSVSVSEPSSVALLGLGMLGLASTRRFRKR